MNISRKGLLFETQPDVRVGAKIELVVQMGAVLEEGPDVRLHVQGVTVRSRSGKVAVAIKKYRLYPAKDVPAEAIAPRTA